MQYNYDVNKIIDMTLPNVLRKSIMTAFLKAINSPLNFLSFAFNVFVFRAKKENNKTGQMILLQRALSEYSSEHGGFGNTVGGDPLPNDIAFYGSNKIFVEEYPNNVILPAPVLIVEKLVVSDLLQVGLVSENSFLQCALIEETEILFDFQVRIEESLIKDVSLKTTRSVVDAYKNYGRNYTVVTYKIDNSGMPQMS